MAITQVNLKDSIYIKTDSIKALNQNCNVTNVLADTLSGNKSEPLVQLSSKEQKTDGYSKDEFWGVMGGVVTVLGLGAGLVFRKQFKNIKALKTSVGELSSKLQKSQGHIRNLKTDLTSANTKVTKQKSVIKQLNQNLAAERQTVSQQMKMNSDLTGLLKTSEGKVQTLETNLAQKSELAESLTKETAAKTAEISGLRADLTVANNKITGLSEQVNSANQTITGLNGEVSRLNKQVVEANSTIARLEDEINATKEALDEAINTGHTKKTVKAKLEQEIAGAKLDYDPMNPHFVVKGSKFKPEQYDCVYADIKTGTTNRAGMAEFEIPKGSPIDGSFYFELPTGAMKVRKADLRKIDEPFEITSNISEKYAESVVWNDDKVARDLLQNFFDGHGQTLDGVMMRFIPLGGGKFKVRIEGKSIYDFKHAIIMGESTSHEISQAAGNYGEGLKMATLKLLKQNEGASVKVGAGNWEVVSTIRKDARLDSDLMHYNISPVEFYDGNFIEFETASEGLLESLRKSINRFYHSSNKHFECPDFENDLFGFKLLPKNGDKGAIYISGQRFEYGGDYDGFKNGVLFIKEKIPSAVYDMSRDRGTINKSSLDNITHWLAQSTPNDERKQIMKALESAMAADCSSDLYILGSNVISELQNAIRWKGVGAIKFPEKYVARTTLFPDLSLEAELQSNGYKVFPKSYIDIGMESMTNLINKARQHKPLEPTEVETKKIAILKRALNRLKGLTKEHFTPEELDTHIYIFDAKSAVENSATRYDNALAEAIIDNGVQKGFWIDREYLNRGRFSDVFETALHELSHKVGGDGTEAFGYKLTNVNKDAIAEILENPEIAQEFRALSEIWAKL